MCRRLSGYLRLFCSNDVFYRMLTHDYLIASATFSESLVCGDNQCASLRKATNAFLQVPALFITGNMEPFAPAQS